jgi:hypothetical protein
VPSGELKSRGIAYVAVVLFVSFSLAWVERSALTATPEYLMLIAIMVGLSVGVMAFDRASRPPAAPLDLGEPPPLPTQRLDLAS